MKKKNLDLKKKLVLSKETIANLTPGQQTRLAGGYMITNTYCSINCDTGNTECNTNYNCANTHANCGGVDTAHCATQDAICAVTRNCQTP